MGNITLSELTERIRRRSDQENSTFVTDNEIRDMANFSLGELQDILISAYDTESFLDGYEFSTVVGQTDYPLPDDMYKLAGVDMTKGSCSYEVKKYKFNERNIRSNSSYIGIRTADFAYRLYGNSIKLLPEPSGVNTVTLHYIPQVTELVLDTDVVDNIYIKSWIEYVIVDVAIKIIIKEESDPNALMAQKGHLVNRIEKMKEERDFGTVDTVTDVYVDDYFYDWA